MSIQEDGLAFFWRHLGRCLVPADAVRMPDGATCSVTGRSDLEVFDVLGTALSGPIWALSRNHRHRDGKKAAMRLGGAKSAALITENGAILMADVLLEQERPCAATRVEPTDWRTVPNWSAEIILNPPPPPFLYVVFGKSPAATVQSLRVTVSHAVVHLCGPESKTIHRNPVVTAFSKLSGVEKSVWQQAAYIGRDRAARRIAPAEADRRLAALTKRVPTLAALLAELPNPGTDEWDALNMIVAQAEKEHA